MKYSSYLKINITVIMIILALLGLSYIVVFFAFKNEGSYITIEKDGALVGTYSLEAEQEIPLSDDDTNNIVVIEKGKAFMKEASCPDHLCMKQGKISKEGQTIVCLPNKVIVTVISDDSGQDKLDAMVQ